MHVKRMVPTAHVSTKHLQMDDGCGLMLQLGSWTSSARIWQFLVSPVDVLNFQADPAHLQLLFGSSSFPLLMHGFRCA